MFVIGMKTMKFKFTYIFGLVGYGLWLVYCIVMTVNSSGDPVAFWHLSEKVTSFLLLLVWPLFVSVAFLFLAVKVITPIFLKVKMKFQKQHSFAYLPQQDNILDPKVMYMRLFQLFLLTLGLVDALINAGILLPENFITQVTIDEWISRGIDPRFHPVVLGKMLSLIIPIASGLWIVSWVLEDLGVLQFKLPESNTQSELYEIQPTHKIYSSLISGYGGFSSLLFYIGFIIYYFTDYSASGGNFADLFMVLIMGLSALSILPVYFIYWKIKKESIIVGLKQAPQLTQSIL
ncbi:hypothetical protein WKT22_05167 [Candidatus Lokiarchaeum ossiferum]